LVEQWKEKRLLDKIETTKFDGIFLKMEAMNLL